MRIRIVWTGILLAAALSLTACQGKQGEEARLTGIEQMKNKDYIGAVQSFEQALEHSGGKVGAFELDVLKYRAEAEYLLTDYEAAAHTYGVLLQVDGKRLEYHLYRSMALAEAGQLETAVDEYQAAAALAETGDKDEDKTAVAELLLSLGTLLEAQPEHRETAGTLYQDAIDKGQASAALYNRRGLVYLGDKDGGQGIDLDEAVRLFEAGLAMGETAASKDLLFNQAVAYERKLEFSKALQLFEQYAQQFGSDETVNKEIEFLKTR